MYTVQTVAPIKEPVSLEEAKLFIRILDDDEDFFIEALIKTAREKAENFTNRQFEKATYELYTSSFIQDMKMPKNPISSIKRVEVMGEDGNYEELEEDDYYLYGENDIFRIHFENIKPHKQHKKAIKITFIAGYSEIPKSIIQAIKIYVSTLYEFREAYVSNPNGRTDIAEVPICKALLYPYRIQPL